MLIESHLLRATVISKWNKYFVAGTNKILLETNALIKHFNKYTPDHVHLKLHMIAAMMKIPTYVGLVLIGRANETFIQRRGIFN